MAGSVTFELSERDKDFFRATVEAAGPEEEQAVLEDFPAKLAELRASLSGSAYVPDFLRGLIDAVELLHRMLADPDAQLDAGTRRWITAALGYFISPVDAIPDTVPVFGYLDDAVLVAWVCQVLGPQISSYKASHSA